MLHFIKSEKIVQLSVTGPLDNTNPLQSYIEYTTIDILTFCKER